MLNRRVLRVKAMQALYAYTLSAESALEIKAEELGDKFKFDPAKHDSAEKKEFDRDERRVKRLFWITSGVDQIT